MANPMKGEAQLGTYTLAFNFGAFCALEERSGKKVPELLQAMSDGLGFSDVRDFVWAGLQLHHRELTDQQILELLEEVGFSDAGLAVGKAVTRFFDEQREKGKNPPKAAAA